MSVCVCAHIRKKYYQKTRCETYGAPILLQKPPALVPYGDLPQGLTEATLLSCEVAEGV